MKKCMCWCFINYWHGTLVYTFKCLYIPDILISTALVMKLRDTTEHLRVFMPDKPASLLQGTYQKFPTWQYHPMYKCGINTYFMQQTGSEELHVVTLYWVKAENEYKLMITVMAVLMDVLLGKIPATNSSYGSTPHSMYPHNDKVESLTFNRCTGWYPIKCRPFLSKRENTFLE